MIKALLLIFDSAATWERIKLSQRSVPFIAALYACPLILIACACEGFGLVRWGRVRGEIPKLRVFERGEAAAFELAQFLLFFGVLMLGAYLVRALGQTFHGRHRFRQTFTVVAFSLSPLFLLHTLNAFRGVSPWVTWALGILFSIGVLYHGLPRIMEPDPPHAFGLYLMSALLLLLITGLLRLLTWWYLIGKFLVLDKFFQRVGALLSL